MDFKFRDVDEKPSNPQPSSSSNPLPVHGFRPDSVCYGSQPDSVLREWEKAQIREEIIASEIARRRALEVEVRRELTAEWEMTGAIHRALQTSSSLPFMPLFNNYNRWRPEPRFNLFPPLPPSSLSLPPLPFMSPSPPVTEVAPDTSEGKKDKLIIMAKPYPDRVLGAKRKTPPLAETSEPPLPLVSSKVKQPKKWSCDVCRINTTSEKGLADHLKGKNHKANEAKQTSQGMEKTSNTSSNTVTLQKKLGESDQKLEDKETIKNEKDELQGKVEVERFMKKISADSPEKKDGHAAKDEVETTPELSKKKKYKFWCEICLVGAYSEVVMETHKKGKKHIKELNKKNVAALATATAATNTVTEPKIIDQKGRKHIGKPDKKNVAALATTIDTVTEQQRSKMVLRCRNGCS